MTTQIRILGKLANLARTLSNYLPGDNLRTCRRSSYFPKSGVQNSEGRSTIAFHCVPGDSLTWVGGMERFAKLITDRWKLSRALNEVIDDRSREPANYQGRK